MVTLGERLGEWFLHDLPRLNRAVLYGGAPATLVHDELARTVLPELPATPDLQQRRAQQLVVELGLAGASVARHYQEQDPGRKSTPSRAFDGLRTASGAPFRRYFAELADRTGTGHAHRDSYASLVLWNVPTTQLCWRGETLAQLPGVFGDGLVRSYTGSADERRFFELIKKSETIELAVNDLLRPISDGAVAVIDPDAARRARDATVLLRALRRLFVDFAALPPGESLAPTFFLDVFRQFAVHWDVGDIPPSGALDAAALQRDFLLGIAYPGYERHVERILPGLLGHERAALSDLMSRPPLPVTLLHALGLGDRPLADLPPAELGQLVTRHPAVADWYRLLSTHARAAGAHLMLSKRYLFNPQRHRDATGAGDRALVSNRRGTTGMDETLLDGLTRARREHPLSALRRVPGVAAEDDVDDAEAVQVVISDRPTGPATCLDRPPVTPRPRRNAGLVGPGRRGRAVRWYGG